jgi:hypothetical protein
MEEYEVPCRRCGTPTTRVHDNLCVSCAISYRLREFMPHEPSYRYWTGEDGWRYCWTTEKMGDGRYAAFMYKPVGKGARSGKATSFVLVKEIHFNKRTTAKARAAKWFNTRHGANRQIRV